MLNKEIVFNTVKKELEKRSNIIQATFDDLKDALYSSSKNTVGDKHETNRAMIQLEQEKLSQQLVNIINLKNSLNKINPKEQHKVAQYGSLINTSDGLFFLSIGLGKVNINNQKVFCITATTRLGMLLIGKHIGDNIRIDEKKITILDLI